MIALGALRALALRATCMTFWASTASVALLAGCSMSISTGAVDYGELEREIAEKLNGTYAGISRQVSGVDCPDRSEVPKAGDTFVCDADVEGRTVRVQVHVKDDEYNVDFSTLDVVYDLPSTAEGLSRQISEYEGTPVTVTCGEGIEVVEIGKSFDCTTTGADGRTRTVRLTAGAVGEDDHWEIPGE